MEDLKKKEEQEVTNVMNEKKITNKKLGMIIGICASVIMIIGTFFPFYTIEILGIKGNLGFFDFDGFNDGYFFIGIGLITLTFAIFKHGIPLAFFSVIELLLAVFEIRSDNDGYFITGPAIGFYLILYGALLGVMAGFFIWLFKIKKKDDEAVSKNNIIILSAIAGILAVLIIVFELFSENFGNSNIDNEITYSDEELKVNDISLAKTIKTAFEAAMSDESIYDELIKSNEIPILITEEGLNVISEMGRMEIKNNIGDSMPKVNYTQNGAEVFSVIIDKNGTVSVFVGTYSNPAMYELVPETDELYLGGNADTEVTELEYNSDLSNTDSLIAQDISNAKMIKTAIESSMSGDDVYQLLTTTYSNILITLDEKTLNQLPETCSDSILYNIGNYIPEINYTDDGAVGYAFMVDENGMVTVYISSDDDLTKWVIDGDERSLDYENSQSKQQSLESLIPTTTEAVIIDEKTDEYIIEVSSSEYISLAGLSGFSKEECRLARNEIYARHGRLFKDSELQAYFDSCDWYNGYIEPDSFDESVLNDYERENLQVIMQYEEEMGYR